jgi:lysyl-tRNA synthetase class II
MIRTARVIAALLVAAPGAVLAQSMTDRMADQLNDYPTAARAEYVFACMAANGENQVVLQKCACSIDVIASILPYEKYVEAETVLSMQQVRGERTAMFRTTKVTQDLVAELRRAQAEAEISCF